MLASRQLSVHDFRQRFDELIQAVGAHQHLARLGHHENHARLIRSSYVGSEYSPPPRE